jgi:chemotaxis protein CheZ
MPDVHPTPLSRLGHGTQGQHDEAALCAAVRQEVAPLFADLRRFVDRRIAELSVEVHGATQLLGFSETNLSSQLGRLHEQVGRMLGAPGLATRNSGLELEAVVQATEAAANQIMEAAEAIGECVRIAIPDKEAMAAISTKIDAIFEACAFQDLTGQRVRRAIEHLQHVESALCGMMAPPGTPHELYHPPAPTVASDGPDQNQADIDALFAD